MVLKQWRLLTASLLVWLVIAQFLFEQPVHVNYITKMFGVEVRLSEQGHTLVNFFPNNNTTVLMVSFNSNQTAVHRGKVGTSTRSLFLTLTIIIIVYYTRVVLARWMVIPTTIVTVMDFFMASFIINKSFNTRYPSFS